MSFQVAFRDRTGVGRWFIGVLAALGLVVGAEAAPDYRMDKDTRVLVVVLDGFRSDYLTPHLMPRCYPIIEQGVIGKAHHVALPTVTRVNAPTLVTGCYPARHGLVANTLYVPELNSTQGISTASRKNLLDAAKVWGGHLLAVPTLAELLEPHGDAFLACSSGSSGSATLLNPTGAGAGILHPEFCVPETQTARLYEILGPKPPESEPAEPAIRWMTDAYLKIGVPERKPRVTFLWFTDPDHTAHNRGIGASETVESIRLVDEQLARILDFHRAQNLKVNVFIVADHGFLTRGGPFEVAGAMKKAGFNETARPLIIDGAIYLRTQDEPRLPEMVRALQENPTIGPIFTPAKKRGDWKGIASGTLSHDLVHSGHPHGAQIIAYPNWTAERNSAGYAGKANAPGTAGHGGTSPWEINAVFAAFGPDIKTKVTSSVPTSNADLAPTIAALIGMQVPTTMDGRVLHEVLKPGPDPSKVRVQKKSWTAAAGNGKYRVTLQASIVAGHRYVDEVKAEHQ